MWYSLMYNVRHPLHMLKLTGKLDVKMKVAHKDWNANVHSHEFFALILTEDAGKCMPPIHAKWLTMCALFLLIIIMSRV